MQPHAISRADGMPAPKGHDRKLISLPPGMREEISDFRHEARLKTENEAYQELLRRGLRDYRREKAAAAKKKPR